MFHVKHRGTKQKERNENMKNSTCEIIMNILLTVMCVLLAFGITCDALLVKEFFVKCFAMVDKVLAGLI